MEGMDRRVSDVRDRRLVARAAAGDRDAFGALATGYRDAIYSFACRMLSDSDRAFDAAQETFVKAWDALGSFDTSRPFRPWLFAICANVCTDMLRRRRYQPSLDDEQRRDPPDPEDTPERRVEEIQAHEAISDALQAVSDTERTVVILKYVRGWSYPEISEATGMPVGTLKSHAHRARKKLAEAMQTQEAVTTR
jgi:RNA polymerase sigma-70 factor (ECF subfamily)